MWLGHEGGALMYEVSDLWKGSWEPSCPQSAMKGLKEKLICNLKRTLSKTSHAGTLVSDFQPPELWEINFCRL